MERRLAAVLATDMVGYSRLMEADEAGTLARQKACRHEIVDPEIERCRGRIVKTTGDGLLATFASASDAVRCAIDIQTAMRARETNQSDGERIQFRIGINVGDIVFEDADIFGDGVNVAARLEGLAEPGGVCISDATYQMVQDRLGDPFVDLGSQKVKNISRAVRVWQWTSDASVEDAAEHQPDLNQRVQFCIAPDGVQIAYASVGSGPPIFKAPNWLNHIEYEWRSPVWGPFLAGLANNRQLVRFDQRGGGLSDWDVDTISVDAMISDMATVADAAGLERSVLFGISQGCAFSVRYAVEYPERVSCLILLGGFLRGIMKRNSADQEKLFEAAQTMIRQGWGSPNPLYRHFFTSAYIPDANPDQLSGFDELQRVTVAPENAARINEMNSQVDVSDLAGKVQVPTLVLHCDGDRRVPLEEGRRIAALIPDARFVALESNNHALLEGSPAFDTFFSEVDAFLEEHAGRL